MCSSGRSRAARGPAAEHGVSPHYDFTARHMRAWERRLRDLRHVLNNCAETYFDPDLFRMNTNHFLQTSRTVTFLIAKDKAQIPDYETWHRVNVLEAWKHDPFMHWAKNSRNVIEKEGDLDLNSTLQATLLFSYLEEEDIRLTLGRDELLEAGVKKLLRLAQKALPTGVSDAAAIKVERRWVTASLPNHELLHALFSVYKRIEECCSQLAHHLGTSLLPQSEDDQGIENLVEEARHIRYFKLQTATTVSLRSKKVDLTARFAPPPALKDALDDLRSKQLVVKDLPTALAYFGRMAHATFTAYGHHVPMLFLFDEYWRTIAHLGTEFEDQVDKYIFWRSLADRVHADRVKAIVWISEAWIRDSTNAVTLPIRKLPIRGEVLNVVGVDWQGTMMEMSWRIIRADGTPKLERDTEDLVGRGVLNFLAPAMKAMGIANPSSVKPILLQS